MPACEILRGRRLVAAASALDRVEWPVGVLVLRLAPDEALVVGVGEFTIDDSHAIVEPDASFSGLRMAAATVQRLLVTYSDWELPEGRPSLTQGLVAGIPAKVWMDDETALIIVPTPYAHELEERLA